MIHSSSFLLPLSSWQCPSSSWHYPHSSCRGSGCRGSGGGWPGAGIPPRPQPQASCQKRSSTTDWAMFRLQRRRKKRCEHEYGPTASVYYFSSFLEQASNRGRSRDLKRRDDGKIFWNILDFHRTTHAPTRLCESIKS